ncbi:MAG: ankyrin repeat domain-containing protein [Methylocystaceae bacterium]|nr:ankyrin repeat domain-containing protein [Methylocystaceae bacterium]
MNPEQFFTEQKLVAYRLAHQGATDRLIEMHKARQVDLNEPGKDDLTLLGLAVLNADAPAIISLLRAGADANQVIPSAGSPAVLAITKYAAPPRIDSLRALIDGGYDINARLRDGKPYLFFIVDYKHWPAMDLCLNRGGSLNTCNSGGKSLLTYMIEGGDYVQARALIEKGANVAAHGRLNQTALLAIEAAIRAGDPSEGKRWHELVNLRKLILSRLVDPNDRRTVFTDTAERLIRENP